MIVLQRLPVFLLAMAIFISTFVRSQALFQVSSDDKISGSGLIVEGKVIQKNSYWNPRHTMIYTSNEVEVYKIFKGSPVKKTISVITTGGVVDNYCIVASDLLTLDNNDIGLFFCQKSNHKGLRSGSPAFEVYSSSQGFLKYDLRTKTASAPFVRYDDIERQLYKELSIKTGRKAEVINNAFSVEAASKILSSRALNSTTAPVITSFSPATVTGGTLQDPANNVLTINGSGFDNNPNASSSAVEFAHADKTAGNFADIPSDSNLIISWTNTQIKIRVPTSAGTGTFRVRNSSGVTANSPSVLNVLYTVLSAYINPIDKSVQFNLVNQNGTGGYSIKYSNNTANNGIDINNTTAKATVQRALNTWKELTGVNFTEAGSTSTQEINLDDEENIVVFDNSASGLDPLPNGVLATCYSGLGACDLTRPFFKSGFDIIIRNDGFSTGSVNFTFGPCSPYNSATQQVDLETVLLHEMGHAINLGHIIELPEGSGQGQVNPAKLMNFSVNYNFRRISPDYSAMAGVAYLLTPTGNNYGTCLTANAEMVPLPVTIDSKDECPSTFPVTATPLLTSVPFDLAHCTCNKFTDPAYDQFLTDGSGTGITNTAFYAFRTSAEGGDLSLQISNYATSPATIAACTPALDVPVSGVQMAVYKVNACPGGQAFPAPIASMSFKGDGSIPAITGLSGNTSYLIVLDGVENTKASFNMVFSGSALPKPADDFEIRAYPNPVDVQNVSIQIFNQSPGQYSLVMYNSLGQVALQRRFSITSNSHLETVPVSSLAKGIYHISLLRPDNSKVKAITIAVTK